MNSRCGCSHHQPAATSRRRFLATAALGGAALLAPGLRARAAADAEALLLTCMDYRLFDDIAAYMAGQGLNGKYDHIVLAGASLGAQTGKFPAWSTTFWQHLDTAKSLHGIERVMLLDHRDCGAYKIILGEAAVATPEAETAAHEQYLRSLTGLVRDRYPALKVEGGLMALDGTVLAVEV